MHIGSWCRQNPIKVVNIQLIVHAREIGSVASHQAIKKSHKSSLISNPKFSMDGDPTEPKSPGDKSIKVITG